MKILKCKDPQKTAIFANTWCEEQVNSHNSNNLFIPAGNTPVPLYQLWEQKRLPYLDKLKFLQVDEVINGPHKGIFKRFFEQHIPYYKNQISWISGDPVTADVAILGLGLNGHVAFHEPGIPEHFKIGCVRLSEDTCQNLNTPKDTWGLTYGVGAFSKCQKILVIACGSCKTKILKELLSDNSNVPASFLKHHPGLTIIGDENSLGSLETKDTDLIIQQVS